jgi:hypothetical protein
VQELTGYLRALAKQAPIKPWREADEEADD